MAKVKVRILREGLNDELTRYLALFNDNDEIDLGTNRTLQANWNRLLLLPDVPELNNNSKNIRGRFLSWLSHVPFNADKAKSLLSILKTLDSFKLDSTRYNIVVNALPDFDTAGTEALNDCIMLMHAHKIPLSKHNNLSNLMSKSPAQLDLIASILTELSKLKLTNEHFSTLINSIPLLAKPLDENEHGALIDCLKQMHESNISLTAGDNFQKVMDKPLLYGPLLKAMEPLTRQRFEMVKQLDTGIVLAVKGEFLADIIPSLNKHALPLSSNLPRVNELTGLGISKLSGLLNSVDVGYINQSRFDALCANAESLVMEDEDDNSKVDALVRYITSMARTGLPLTAELGNMMGRPAKEIQGISDLVDAFNNRANRFFNKSSLTAIKYDLICERAATHLVDVNIRNVILSNIKRVNKAGALSDFQLISLIENNPVETNDLLMFLKNSHENDTKQLSKARIKVVTDFAEYLNADKMSALKNCIGLLEKNNIPLTKHDHLARLMRLDKAHLEQVDCILKSMNTVSPQRLAIVLDNLSSPLLDNVAQLGKTIKVLEQKHIPLSKHDCLRTLMSMDSDSLEKFNSLLDTLGDVFAPEAAYEAIIKKLPYLKSNPEKMPALEQVIYSMNAKNIPFTGNFLERLSGKKDSISQLAKLSEGSLNKLSEPIPSTFKADIRSLRKEDRQIRKETGGSSVFPARSIHTDDDYDDDDDRESQTRPG
ncbi:hypothetical protein [Legionella sp. CNM-4043-24]|uniref:hypothetical protein n=1 Tax=Legionella sp. CNM-4043-24 TaxID=3421646 RepID=UPI00403AE94D